MEKIPKVSYSGKILIGDKELSCAVLDETGMTLNQYSEKPLMCQMMKK